MSRPLNAFLLRLSLLLRCCLPARAEAREAEPQAEAEQAARMLSTLCPLLAELPEPTSYAAMGWIIAGVFGIVGLANQGMALWDRLFPRPSPPAHELYATKAELAATRAQIEEEAEKAKREHKESDARIEARFETWMTQQQEQHEDSMRKFDEAMERFTGWQLTMERALGVIGTKADFALEKKGK